jgi:hypothetical protein
VIRRLVRGGLVVMSVGVALVLGGCGSIATSPAAAATPEPTPWSPPADWVTVSTSDLGMQLTLPPWLITFDTLGTIFANKPPPAPGAEIPIQLMATPPGVDLQAEAGDDLVAWLEGRLGQQGRGIPVVTEVSLPAGPAVRYERIDRAGTPTAWRILAVAIRTPSGVAYLQIDGPPDAWPGHAADIERIPYLLRVR